MYMHEYSGVLLMAAMVKIDPPLMLCAPCTENNGLWP